MDQNKLSETLVWKAPSHIHHKRSKAWYLIFFFITLGLLGYAFYTKSILTFLTFLIMAIVVLAVTMESSREITYSIGKSGIAAGPVIYPYKTIKKFWITYNPPMVKTLNFETTAYLNSRITLQLGKQDPLAVKMILSQYLPEDLEQIETLSESLARKLKI